MALSQKAIKELQEHADELKKRVISVRRRYEQAKAELDAADRELNTTLAFLRFTNGDAITPNEKPDIPISSRPHGFRDAIMAVLRAHPSGIRPVQVADVLKNKGFESSGTTDLDVRVGNELYRLHKNGRVERVGRGLYRLPNGGQPC